MSRAVERLTYHAEKMVPLVVSASDVPAIQTLTVVSDGLPEWWTSNGNILLAVRGAKVPNLWTHPGLPPPVDAIVALGHEVVPPSIRLWGDAGLVIIGDRSATPNATFACGPKSTIILGGGTRASAGSEINCRNGGLVYVGPDGLWAATVRIFSDDMHAIREVSDGRRVNPYGGTVAVGRHVWLGFESLLLPGARIGEHSVVGARAVVRNHLAANSVSAGIPARIIRSDITWTGDDRP